MKENFSKLEYLVIISYYDTDIEWTKKIKLPYVISEDIRKVVRETKLSEEDKKRNQFGKVCEL